MKTNEKSFFEHQVPAGFGADEVEFFVMNGEVQFIKENRIHLFSELDVHSAARLRMELDSDPKALAGMVLLGIRELNAQIEKYAFCKYGQLNATPDLEGNGNNPEFWDCGCRPCPAEGLICKFPAVANGHLTKTDVRVIREVAADFSGKMIADNLSRSIETINKECKTIAAKIGCHTRHGIASFAGANNIV